MLDIEKLMRQGRTAEDIERAMKEQIAVYEQKIEQEKEAERIRKIKEEGVEQRRKEAETALQAYYDVLVDKYISFSIEDGKVTVEAHPVRGSRAKSGAIEDTSFSDLLRHLGI